MIRRWRPSDADQLRPMVLRFLKVGEERGSRIMATPANADWFIALGMKGADAGHPCLVSTRGDQIVAYIQWQGIETGLEMRGKPCLTYGAYTLPECRSTGVATTLRDFALDELRRLGFATVEGPVHAINAKGQRYFADRGARVVSLNYELVIGPPT